MARVISLEDTGLNYNDYLDQWSFVVLTSNIIETKLFVNDLTPFTSSQHVANPTTTAIQDWTIGCRDNGSINGVVLNGSIDEFAIWDRVLTDSEIADLYNSGVGRYINPRITFPSTGTSIRSNLVLLHHMDEGEGTLSSDSTTKGNDGTLYGGTTWVTGHITSSTEIPTDGYNNLAGQRINTVLQADRTDNALTLGSNL